MGLKLGGLRPPHVGRLRANRTKVGLKLVEALTENECLEGANRTKVGLKLRFRAPRAPAGAGANRTKVGLKRT